VGALRRISELHKVAKTEKMTIVAMDIITAKVDSNKDLDENER